MIQIRSQSHIHNQTLVFREGEELIRDMTMSKIIIEDITERYKQNNAEDCAPYNPHCDSKAFTMDPFGWKCQQQNIQSYKREESDDVDSKSHEKRRKKFRSRQIREITGIQEP